MAHDTPDYLPADRYAVPKHWMNFGRGERLAQFDRYVFFTPAALYLYGRFDDRPLRDFLAQCKTPVHLMHHLFARPLFAGLQTPDGNADWNRALWAVEAEAWPAFESFMLSVTPYDALDRTVCRVGAQDLLVLDPLYAAGHAVVAADAPLASVVAFGVDGTRGQIAFDPPADPRVDCPRLATWPPQPRTLEFAKRLFAGQNPASAIDPPPALPDKGVDRLQVKDISTLPAEQQAEYRRAIAEALSWKDRK